MAETKTYALDACPDGGGQVMLAPDERERVVQQMEVVPEQVRVEEHRSPAYQCPGKTRRAPLPAPVERGGLIGCVLTARIAYLKSGFHASFSTIRTYRREVMGVPISRSQLAKTIRKASEAFEAPYAELMALLPSQDRLNVDETGHNDNGERFWTWCFRAANFTMFKVAGTRSSNVLFDVLGPEFFGRVWL